VTPERLREIARDCEDVSGVSSEGNADALRRFADEIERGVNHSSWVWNRRIIESIRAAVPDPPVLDEDLVKTIKERFKSTCTDCPPTNYPTDKTRCSECPKRAELLERANDAWRNQQMSTNTVANRLMDLIVKHCSNE